jgi:cytochrome c biogenesis protein CcdA
MDAEAKRKAVEEVAKVAAQQSMARFMMQMLTTLVLIGIVALTALRVGWNIWSITGLILGVIVVLGSLVMLLRTSRYRSRSKEKALRSISKEF